MVGCAAAGNGQTTTDTSAAPATNCFEDSARRATLPSFSSMQNGEY
jgi:hypothetical protein